MASASADPAVAALASIVVDLCQVCEALESGRGTRPGRRTGYGGHVGRLRYGGGVRLG